MTKKAPRQAGTANAMAPFEFEGQDISVSPSRLRGQGPPAPGPPLSRPLLSRNLFA
jgi:hypothetical protein